MQHLPTELALLYFVFFVMDIIFGMLLEGEEAEMDKLHRSYSTLCPLFTLWPKHLASKCLDAINSWRRKVAQVYIAWIMSREVK